MCTHARAHMCTCMHTCVRAHMHTHTRGYLLAALCGFLVVPFSSLVAEHTHVYTCTHIHTCAHMHIHTQMRACTHSHTLTGTHTHMGATFELPYVGFSLCPSRLLWQSTGSGYAVFSSCSPQPQSLWCKDFVAPGHVGSSQIRDRTQVSYIDRETLRHWATREAGILLSRMKSRSLKNLRWCFVWLQCFKSTVVMYNSQKP